LANAILHCNIVSSFDNAPIPAYSSRHGLKSAGGRTERGGSMDGNNPKVGAQDGTMTLTDNSTGKSIDLPVIGGSVGPKVIDVRALYAKTGYFTYDPGFMATAACRSSITYIDGDE